MRNRTFLSTFVQCHITYHHAQQSHIATVAFIRAAGWIGEGGPHLYHVDEILTAFTAPSGSADLAFHDSSLLSSLLIINNLSLFFRWCPSVIGDIRIGLLRYDQPQETLLPCPFYGGLGPAGYRRSLLGPSFPLLPSSSSSFVSNTYAYIVVKSKGGIGAHMDFSRLHMCATHDAVTPWICKGALTGRRLSPCVATILSNLVRVSWSLEFTRE